MIYLINYQYLTKIYFISNNMTELLKLISNVNTCQLAEIQDLHWATKQSLSGISTKNMEVK